MDDVSLGWWKQVDGSIASLIPTFGNYCGPNWSDGRRLKDGEPPELNGILAREPGADGIRRDSPVDGSCFKHDRKYTAAMGQPDEYQRQLQADLDLLRDVSQLDWPNLSTQETAYASLMAVAFAAKIALVDVPGTVIENIKSEAASLLDDIKGHFASGDQSYTDSFGNSMAGGLDATGKLHTEFTTVIETGETLKFSYGEDGETIVGSVYRGGVQVGTAQYNDFGGREVSYYDGHADIYDVNGQRTAVVDITAYDNLGTVAIEPTDGGDGILVRGGVQVGTIEEGADYAVYREDGKAAVLARRDEDGNDLGRAEVAQELSLNGVETIVCANNTGVQIQGEEISYTLAVGDNVVVGLGADGDFLGYGGGSSSSGGGGDYSGYGDDHSNPAPVDWGGGHSYDSPSIGSGWSDAGGNSVTVPLGAFTIPQVDAGKLGEAFEKQTFTAPKNPPHCFVGDTPVLMVDGSTRPIAEVKIGDLVMAFDGGGALEPCPVIRTFAHDDVEVEDFLTEGGTAFAASPNHRVLSAGDGFKSLSQLEANETVLAGDGSPVRLARGGSGSRRARSTT